MCGFCLVVEFLLGRFCYLRQGYPVQVFYNQHAYHCFKIKDQMPKISITNIIYIFFNFRRYQNIVKYNSVSQTGFPGRSGSGGRRAGCKNTKKKIYFFNNQLRAQLCNILLMVLYYILFFHEFGPYYSIWQYMSYICLPT